MESSACSSDSDQPLSLIKSKAQPLSLLRSPHKQASSRTAVKKKNGEGSDSDDKPLVAVCGGNKTRSPHKKMKAEVVRTHNSSDSDSSGKDIPLVLPNARKIVDLREPMHFPEQCKKIKDRDSGTESLEDTYPNLSLPSTDLQVPSPNVAKSEEGKPKMKENPELAKLKRFAVAAGMHCQYKRLFSHCKDISEQIGTLKSFFDEKGLTGPLSLAACQKYRLRKLQEKELAHLNVDNIISRDDGPCLRRRNRADEDSGSREEEGEGSDTDQDVANEWKRETHHAFARLEGIIDSEG